VTDLFDWPAVKAARDEAVTKVTDNAGADFMTRAREFVLLQLKQGELSSEALTELCKAANIVPHNDRAFGAVYSGLSRDKLIVRSGFCARAKGHGSFGGSIWRLSDAVSN
jgi:hypothetical protein